MHLEWAEVWYPYILGSCGVHYRNILGKTEGSIWASSSFLLGLHHTNRSVCVSMLVCWTFIIIMDVIQNAEPLWQESLVVVVVLKLMHWQARQDFVYLLWRTFFLVLLLLLCSSFSSSSSCLLVVIVVVFLFFGVEVQELTSYGSSSSSSSSAVEYCLCNY